MKITRKLMGLFLISYFAFFPGFSFVWAEQQENRGDSSDGASDYYFAPGTDNRLLMKVNVWGEVFKPGTMEVPDKTDLLSLLSFAGGPTENAKLTKVKIVRNNSENKVLTVNIKECMRQGKIEDLPIIKPGDTVIVPRSSFHTFTKYVTFIYNLAIIASVVKLITQ
jgi:hypothetical protein